MPSQAILSKLRDATVSAEWLTQSEHVLGNSPNDPFARTMTDAISASTSPSDTRKVCIHFLNLILAKLTQKQDLLVATAAETNLPTTALQARTASIMAWFAHEKRKIENLEEYQTLYETLRSRWLKGEEIEELFALRKWLRENRTVLPELDNAIHAFGVAFSN